MGRDRAERRAFSECVPNEEVNRSRHTDKQGGNDDHHSAGQLERGKEREQTLLLFLRFQFQLKGNRLSLPHVGVFSADLETSADDTMH